GARAAPVVIGLLIAGLFELKPFLWAPALAGLALVALLRPPPDAAGALRRAAAVAALASLPSLLARVRQAAALAGRDETSFQFCVGCLPRYLADAAWGSHELSFAAFRSFRLAALRDPSLLLATGVAALLVAGIALGAL